MTPQMIQTTVFSPSILLIILVEIGCLLLLLVLFKLLLKLRWLTAICLSFLLVTALPFVMHIFGLAFFPRGSSTKIFYIIQLLIAGICIVILIAQLIKWFSSGPSIPNVNASERKRILEMVEQGKINTDEGTELLDALGRSNAMRGEEKFSRVDVMILIGISLAILGFFLPWVYIRTPEFLGLFEQRGTIYQAGYQTGALGWSVFIIAILSSVPVFVTPKNFLYKISMLQIFLTIIGTVLVISTLVRINDRSGIGLVACFIGFIVGLIASAAKLKRLAA
jgi:hypothetical protein